MSDNNYGTITGGGGTTPSSNTVDYGNKRVQVTTEILENGAEAKIVQLSDPHYEVPYDNTDTDITHHTQVFRLTHKYNAVTQSYVPRRFIDRAYISFSYGGKDIEEFGLIVTYNGKLQKAAYAEFSDNVTDSEVWDGQIFWNSHFKNNSLNLTLSTDGMTQRQLDNFRRWFKPGKARELVLAEHPNRMIYARISSPPQIDLVPFDTPVTVAVAGGQQISARDSYTALYKGSIDISFVMDEPFWRSRANIVNPVGEDATNEGQSWISSNKTFDKKENPLISDILNGETYAEIAIDNMDAYKIIHEDSVPTVDMIPPNTLVSFGTKDAYSLDMSYSIHGSRVGYAKTAFQEDDDATTDVDETIPGGRTAYEEHYDSGINLLEANIGNFEGVEDTIAADEMRDEKQWYGCGYLYYGGTAPVRPIITFSVTPKFDNEGYIISPLNPIKTDPYHYNRTYSTFIVEGEEKQVLQFTTPGVYTGYNQAIRIFRRFLGMRPQASWEELRAALRDNVKHWAPRAYALWVIDDTRGTTATTTTTDTDKLSTCITKMKYFLDRHEEYTSFHPSGSDSGFQEFSAADAIIQINCQTGEVLGTFDYRVVSKQSKIGILQQSVENVGDMIRSNYLTIEERNYPNENGLIQPWDANNKQYSHRYYTDCEMTNVLFQYNYMYY